jgi:2-keto-4-pentenoate hydratase/2-oxohepta-3-ene-1,7-dioic acid hydratase in catechol pathway
MKIVRFENGSGPRFGRLDGAVITVCGGSIATGLTPTNETVQLDSVRLLYPSQASKMVAIWRNSIPLIRHMKEEPTKEVCFVLKPPSCYASDGDTIILPADTERVIFEAELGAVIGRRCKNVSADEAQSVIFGWTAVNEVTAQDVVNRDAIFPQHTKAKSYDTFGVFGPVIETDLDLDQAAIRCFQNGELRQNFSVADLARKPYELVSLMSHLMTLEPGDVISCGSSLGVRPMEDGDEIIVEVTGIGKLTNPVRKEAAHAR